MLRVPFIASAFAILALIIVVLVIALLQGQRHLRSMQSELGRTNEQVVQARAASAELEKTMATLKTELDEAGKKLIQLQGNLDEAKVSHILGYLHLRQPVV